MFLTISFVPGIRALDDAARTAGMVVEFLVQALLVSLENCLPSDFASAFKTTTGEIMSGQPTSFIKNVDKNSCTLGVQGALGLGNSMSLQGINHFLTPLLE